jgi:tetratricopeptide (TPR) repeat protein
MAQKCAFFRVLFTAALSGILLGSCAASASAKEFWVEVRSPNFTVLSNAGEKEARRIADQFEQFREVFRATLPQFRVELGKPLIIFAVKDEDSLKLLLPAFWETKGHMHPAGFYSPGEESHLVAVRTNLEGEIPYEIVYHEYTHAIMNLNVRNLPVWLGEGLAEFYGHSVIHQNEIEVGKIASYHLQILQTNRLIPIETLLTADQHSPYYNENNRASVFYAESWAIVHYLMMDADARKRQLFSKFLSAWESSGDQVQAAQIAFGDLKSFSKAMDSYSRQSLFYVGRLKTSIHGDPKSYSSRELPPAELAARRAFLYVHTQRFSEARASVEEALQADPKLALAYEARGLLAYAQQDFPAAETSFSRAIDLNSSSYFAYFFDAQARMRRGALAADDRAASIASLERAVAMNPQFAPAYSALASVYSTQPDTYEKALQAGVKAVKLEPGNLIYAINYCYVLLNMGKIADAKKLQDRILKAAKTPAEQANAQALGEAMASRENCDRQMAEYQSRAKQEAEEAAQRQATNASIHAAGASATKEASPAPPEHANQQEFAVEGFIASAECNQDSLGRVTLTVNHLGMKFFYSRLSALQVIGGAEGKSAPPPCAEWKGKKARFYFYTTKNKPYAGELSTVLLF